jgi:hypothetical protein
MDEVILDKISPPAGQEIEAIEPETYYSDVRGYDGKGLRVPADLRRLHMSLSAAR